MKNKRITKITAALNAMNKDDIYSMLLFVLYKLKDIPDYLALSELCYILDENNLAKLLSYYGGMTITLPTLKDLRIVVQAMLLYQYVNIENGDFTDGLKAVSSDEFSSEEIKKIYSKILEVLEKYEFTHDN